MDDGKSPAFQASIRDFPTVGLVPGTEVPDYVRGVPLGRDGKTSIPMEQSSHHK
jgi:hypothetical protein